MLYISQISFPGLGIEPFTLNSVAFSIGKFSIAYYGIIITFGIVLAALYVIWRAKHRGISADTILDIALLVVPCGVIGAIIPRFERPSITTSNPSSKRTMRRNSPS